MSGRHRIPVWLVALLALVATGVYWLDAGPVVRASRYAEGEAENAVARMVEVPAEVPVEVTRIVEVTAVPLAVATPESQSAVDSSSVSAEELWGGPRVYGKGETVQAEGLSITLIDYEFSPESGASRAAATYTLRFVNEATQPTQVRLDLAGLSASDSNGIRYVDLMAADCGQSGGLPRRETIELAPDSYSDVNYYLTRENTCESRVDAEAGYVDVSFASVRYGSGGQQRISDLTFRLSR